MKDHSKTMKDHDRIFQQARQDYADALTADIEQDADAKMRQWNAQGGAPRMLKLKNGLKRRLGISR